jgi:hypothetical protein
MSRLRKFFLYAAYALFLPGAAPSHAAAMWINCGQYEDSVFVLGKSLPQAERNAAIICPQGYQAWVRCSGKGWYAMIRTGGSGNVGYSCGYGDREAATGAALSQCRKNGGSCDKGRSGYDPGLDHNASNATATMGGNDEIYY